MRMVNLFSRLPTLSAFTSQQSGGSCGATVCAPRLGLEAIARSGLTNLRNGEDVGIVGLSWRASLLLRTTLSNALRWVGRPKRSQAGWRLRATLAQSARNPSIDISITAPPKK